MSSWSNRHTVVIGKSGRRREKEERRVKITEMETAGLREALSLRYL